MVGLMVLLVSFPALAQEGPSTVTKWYLFTVKSGHDLQWEEAYQEHLDWRRQHKDTWTWQTYMIVSGERLGQYLTMSSGHRWADFDSPSVPGLHDMADATSKLGPHIESLSSGF